MKKMTAALLSLLLLLMAFECSYAYTPASSVKVGLAFGSEAVDSFYAQTNGSTVIGYTYDHGFYPQMTLPGVSNILVEKGGGAYLRSSTPYESLEQAAQAARALRETGVYAYGGYYEGNNYLMIGLYTDMAEAERGKADLAYTGIAFTAVELDTKAVMVSAQPYYFVFRSTDEVFAFGSADGSTVTVNQTAYYGYILADRTYSSGISIVNLVGMDDYVACVVGSEMYASWPIEALKAQAVIARTYACASTSYHAYGIDVTDDTRSQAYYGTDKETEATRRAAAETSGVIVLYQDVPAQTFFGSCSGGKTADVYSAWGGGQGLDYLVSVDDPYEDVENIEGDIWSVTFGADEVAAKLANIGVNIGAVTNITVTDRGERDERVRGMRFTGTEGSYMATFESCRTILGLRSQYFYIRSDTQPANVSVLSQDGAATVDLANAQALGAEGSAASDSYVMVSGEGMTRTVTIEQDAPQDSFTFDGRGYGHGIGLSQYGAKGMAEAGFGYAEIIAHYYPGTSLSI